MIKLKQLFLLVSLTIISFMTFSQDRSHMTIYFTTLGNCGICQNRIQNAVKDMPGVDTVYWNIPKKQTTVTYDEAVTDPYAIMHAIANVGHDNEWFRAPDSAYNLLVGSCCEYPRTINYDTVRVGYLGMMGIWIYPAAIQKTEPKDISVYPTVGTGIFRLHTDGSSALANPEILVYAMSGKMIFSAKFLPSSDNVLDLRSFPEGQYLVVLFDNLRIIFSTKIIKTLNMP